MSFTQPMQLSLMSKALDELRDEQRLVGLWLGGERWLRFGKRQVSAFVFFHLRDGGEAVLSIRTEEQCLPSKVYGRWWLEGTELVVALGNGEIRGRYYVEGNVLNWADEVLVRRSQSSTQPPAQPETAASPAAIHGAVTPVPACHPTQDPKAAHRLSSPPPVPAARRASGPRPAAAPPRSWAIRLQYELEQETEPDPRS